MSWTALQLAGVYQTLANGGERVEPRIISKVVGPGGQEVAQPEPERTRVVSEQTAHTVVDMFRSTFQSDPAGLQNGTAGGSSLEGYQLAGKTGTAQKVNPETGAYSQNQFWITFAGIAPGSVPGFVAAQVVGALVAAAAAETNRYPDNGATVLTAALAERAGLPRSVIARLETGAASISSDRLWVIAAALGTKPSRLLAAAEADDEAAATLEQ